MLRHNNKLLLPIAALSACIGESTTVRVIDRVDSDGTYFTRDVELVTLEEVAAVTGTIAELRGEASLDVLGAPPADEGVGRDQVVEGDRQVAARWVMDGDVVVPADFDSLSMFSAYAHLERAALFFQDLGARSAETAVPVYYLPKIELATQLGLPRTDNAAFFPNADALLLLPMKILQDIPFPMNPGVLGHEYSHRIFYYEAWGAQMFRILVTAIESDAQSLNNWNIIRGVDEGVADYYGALLADDPRFLSHSVFPALAEPRDLTVERAMDPAWRNGDQPVIQGGVYDPYAVGAVVASTLWGFKDIVGAEITSSAVIAAQRAVAAQIVGQFDSTSRLVYALGDFERALLLELPATSRTALCDRARISYGAVWDVFSGVCA